LDDLKDCVFYKRCTRRKEKPCTVILDSERFVCADMRITEVTEEKSSGVKYDNDKLRYDLLDPEYTEGIVKVLTLGAKKYAADNWKNVPDPKNRYYAALMRHIQDWRKGEILDEEWGTPHLHHAACCLMFLSFFRDIGEKNDS
jgi:hypothetical protein